LFFLTFLTGCATHQQKSNDVATNRIFSDPSLQDHAPLFRAAIFEALRNGNGLVTVAPGTYRIKSLVWDGEITDSIVIRGEGEVILICSSTFGAFVAPSQELTLATPVNRGDKVLRVSPRFNLAPGATPFSMALMSNDIVENSWKYKKGEMALASEIKSGNISLKDPLNFSYNPGLEKVRVRLYSPGKLVLENLTFQQVKNKEGALSTGIRILGCSVRMKNISSSGEAKTRKVDFANIRSASSVEGSGIKLDDLRYGLLINYSRNVFMSNLMVENVIHPVAPSTFTTNVKVQKIRGNNTSIDAHVAFNVHYDDVVITENGGFALRAFGVRLTNSRIVPPVGRKKITRLSVQSLRKPYAFLAREYDVTIRNVEYLGELSSRNGFNVFTCRDFLVDKCITHEVSSSKFVNSFRVVNSRIGRLRCYNNEFSVAGTEFNGAIQGIKDVKPPLSGSYGGLASIADSSFLGYDSTFLIGYMHEPRSTEYEFKNCIFGAFAGAVERTNSKAKTYQPLRFIECKFTGPALKHSTGVPVFIR
jgi:hypothetical protein